MEEILVYIIKNPFIFFSIGGLGLLLVAFSVYKKSQETQITYEEYSDDKDDNNDGFEDVSYPSKDPVTNTTSTTNDSGDNGEKILKIFNHIAVLVMSVIIYVIGFRYLTRNNSPMVAFAMCYGIVYCGYNFIIKPSIFKK